MVIIWQLKSCPIEFGKTEEMIQERQKEIKEFLMTEKDLYLEAMGIQADW